MVAITVILAAVIGAFVLEIGNQQETAPNSSFSHDQDVRFYEDSTGDTNLTTIDVTHAGGETMGISRLNINVEGNGSAWGPTGDQFVAYGSPVDIYRPQPDHFEAVTTNDPVTVSSGDVWTINAYHGWSDASVKNKWAKGPFGGQYYEGSSGPWGSAPGCESSDSKAMLEDPSVNLATNSLKPPLRDTCTDRLEAGDEVRLVWHSSSGGKTQTLTKYTVRQDGSPSP
jgi:FlaG/FlaF family flagellin (archaellin)